ncbi:thiamine phosphate synthase [Pedobacter flavus]|uniref:Thiamine phosphate synthase n=1 Tax=Pedobacter flavus TaxID=3113906 RepID=A0ABU7GZ82_9SPHI|nr:thiamine phosphate synthase [Pedobacter sp. VNH31]MEE1884334.1 thiamine phosphate synthase [Pedobacter sp. VNH31]
MKKYIDKFHFITNNNPKLSSVSQAQLACEAGGKWIQYRELNKPQEEVLREINEIAEICDEWGATLIVTDHIHLAGKADIQGFHLEDFNANLKEIREIIGENYTLGISAKTPDEVLKHALAGADYIGYGPFSNSTTKPNNYTHISLADYKFAKELIQKNNLETPIIAVGGIKYNDVIALKHTGIYGIAASAAIIDVPDFYEAYQMFLL